MLRLFTGLALPLELRQQLHLLQGGIAGARWTDIGDFHVTLSFIGNVDEGTAEDIDEILSGICVDAFTLTLKGAGCFSRGDHPGHLWIGVEHNAALHHLKEKIDRAFEAHRLPVDHRKYTPHVTVASLKQADKEEVAGFIQRNNLFAGEPFAVEEFILYESHQANAPLFYEALEVYPIGDL